MRSCRGRGAVLFVAWLLALGGSQVVWAAEPATEEIQELVGLLKRAQGYEKASKLKEAVTAYEEVVAKSKRVLGEGHTTTATLMNNLAGLYRSMGEYAKAEPLYLRSLMIREEKLGKDHLDVAASLNNLAGVYYRMGQSAKAEPLYLRSLKIYEEKLGKDHPNVATTLNNLAELYRSMGQSAKAEPLYLRGLKIMEEKLGKDHPLVATSLNNLALLYKDMGQYAKAEPLSLRSLKIMEEKLGKDHPDVATALHNLALLYQSLGQSAKAEPLIERSLKIREEKLGKDHPDVATSLNNLAELYQKRGQYAKAEPLYLRSLKIREEKRGNNHPDVATALNNLAALYQDMGQYAKAESLYQRSLMIKEEQLGKDHPAVATSLNNLAALYQGLGQYAKAEPLYLRSLQIREEKQGKDHPDLALALNNLAALQARQDRSSEAALLFERARRNARRHLAITLPALSESEKAAFFQNTDAQGDLEWALSLGLMARAEGKVARLSASWLVNGKGVAQESLASSVLLTRQSSDPVVGKLVGQLRSARQQLAQLTHARPRPGQEKERLEQIADLTAQEEELGKQLRQQGSKAAPPEWVELAAVRKALPPDGVLIDVALFGVFDFKAKPGKETQPARYAAWITPPSGAVQVIDLGPAERIDAAVTAFRAAMQGAGKLIRDRGESEADRQLRPHLEALSKLVLQPLLPHLKVRKRWLVSPDGNLWLIPWEALLLADGRSTLEKYRISYLTSGRDVLASPKAKVKQTAPLVVADPDFDLDPEKARSEVARLGSGGTDGTPAVSGGLPLGRVKRLAGTAGEAKAITPSLEKHAGVTPLVRTREQALEGVVKAVRNPRVLVLCTHGFFLPDQELPRDEKDGKPKAAKRWENPLLRCGVLLAGCNKASEATKGDDGVLTGLEVVETDLRGCELVVLSACDTGVGKVQSGEGVAGAESVVSPLWQVPDGPSARLMAFFFGNLAKGMERDEALRAAKLKVIAERRDDFAVAHPLYWAAYTLTGR